MIKFLVRKVLIFGLVVLVLFPSLSTADSYTYTVRARTAAPALPQIGTPDQNDQLEQDLCLAGYRQTCVDVLRVLIFLPSHFLSLAPVIIDHSLTKQLQLHSSRIGRSLPLFLLPSCTVSVLF